MFPPDPCFILLPSAWTNRTLFNDSLTIYKCPHRLGAWHVHVLSFCQYNLYQISVFIVGDMSYNGLLLPIITGFPNCVDSLQFTALINNSLMTY